MMRRISLFTLVLGAFASACGGVSEEIEPARGVIGNANSVLVLSVVFVVVAVGIILGAVALDRFVRSRRALEELPEAAPEEEEEEEPVVAGIGQGSAGVPRWLYGVYVVIPIFALAYVVANTDIRAELAPPSEETPSETEGPGGVPTEIEIAAENIQFDLDAFTLQANTEVSIVFENLDSLPHNVAIYETEEAQNEIFVGETFTGVATQTYTFESPDPGEYYFHCDVHPGMNGTATFAEAQAAPAEGEGGATSEVTAENIQFDTDTLEFPAETEVTITFHNEDTLPHNIAIYETDAATEEIFVGETFTGVATREYAFETPAAGEYYFHCDVHPGMNGTVLVS